jgi:hypothetical protein
MLVEHCMSLTEDLADVASVVPESIASFRGLFGGQFAGKAKGDSGYPMVRVLALQERLHDRLHLGDPGERVAIVELRV